MAPGTCGLVCVVFLNDLGYFVASIDGHSLLCFVYKMKTSVPILQLFLKVPWFAQSNFGSKLKARTANTSVTKVSRSISGEKSLWRRFRPWLGKWHIKHYQTGTNDTHRKSLSKSLRRALTDAVCSVWYYKSHWDVFCAEVLSAATNMPIYFLYKRLSDSTTPCEILAG